MNAKPGFGVAQNSKFNFISAKTLNFVAGNKRK